MSKNRILSLLWIFLSIGLGFCNVNVNTIGKSVEITFDVPAIDIGDIKTEYGDFVSIRANDADYSKEPGAPKLPVFVFSVGILPEGSVELEYQIDWGEPIKLTAPIVPVDSVFWEHSNVKSIPIPPRDEFYRIKATQPDEPVKFAENGWIRSQHIGRLIISPVKYNPVDGTIAIASSIIAKLNFTGHSGVSIDEGHFEQVLKSVLINYEQARMFRHHRVTIEIPDNPFAASDVWYRCAVREGGVFAITRDWFQTAELDPDIIDPHKIRIFESNIGTLPVVFDDTLPTLHEMALHYIGDDDDIFETGESLLVYVPGPEWWTGSSGMALWHKSPYCDSVSIWVALDGDFTEPVKRLNPISYTGEASQVDVGWTFSHYGIDQHYDEYEGYGWYWQLLYFSASANITDPRIAVDIAPNGWVAASPKPDSICCNSSCYRAISGTAWIEEFQPGSNVITCIYNYNPTWGDSCVYLQYIDIQYAIELAPREAQLRFFTIEESYNDSVPLIEYTVSDFDEPPTVWDVSNIQNIRELSANPVGENYTFLDSAEIREYYIFSHNSVKPLPEPVMENDFKLWENGAYEADYLILSSDIFDTSPLEDFEEGFIGLSTKTIDLDQIMKEFGFGRYDATAVRNYLCYAYNIAGYPKPQYAVFIGDGHYDYRHVLTTTPVYFPPAMYASKQSDIYYVTFDSMATPVEMISGRLPARSQSELEEMIDKMERYYPCAPFGDWRIRAVMAADDEYRTDGSNDRLTYAANNSNLIESEIPSRLIPDPVYLIEYPRAPSLKKPEARDALISKINRGCVWANWIGHGNYHLWAHEHILNLPGDLSGFQNSDKMPLISAFSCDVSQFYFLGGKECIGELLVRMADGGAIATIAATYGTFASTNHEMNKKLVRNLFGEAPISIGAAMVASRARLFPDSDASYILMGDPALTIAFAYDAIAVSTEPETLIAGEWITVTGTTATSFDGVAQIFLFAPNQSKYYESPVVGVGELWYTVPGNIIFSGAASVNTGVFELDIFVPKNLVATDGFKIVVYAFGEEDCTNSSGALGNIFANLESGIDIIDTIGPEIDIHFDVASFGLSGIVCSKDGSLPVVIDLYDEHGISMGGRPGQGILLQLDDEFHTVDISQTLTYELDDPTRAQASYSFTDVEYGGHTVCVQAWDNMGNAMQECVDIELADCSAEIYDAIPYPNPFHDGVDITFALAGTGATADVTLEIFSLGGRRIFSKSKYTSEPFDWLHWDGKSSSGEPVARGVYIFVLKADLKSIDGETHKKTLRGKIVKK